MSYVYIEDDKWIGPVELRSRFKNVRAWHTLSDAERAKYGWYPLHIANPDYNPATQVRGRLRGFTLAGGVVSATYPLRDKNLAEVKYDKRQLFKSMRDISIPSVVNNVQVRSPEDRENVQGAINNFDALGVGGTIGWVMADNSIMQLTKAQLEAVALGYAQAKAAAFAIYEAAIAELEAASTIQEVLELNYPTPELEQ